MAMAVYDHIVILQYRSTIIQYLKKSGLPHARARRILTPGLMYELIYLKIFGGFPADQPTLALQHQWTLRMSPNVVFFGALHGKVRFMKRLVLILTIAGLLAAAGTGLSFAEPAKITVLQTGGVSGHLYPCPT